MLKRGENNMDYTLNDLERIRRIKIEMLNESRTKQGRSVLLNDIFRLEDEIDLIISDA